MDEATFASGAQHADLKEERGNVTITTFIERRDLATRPKKLFLSRRLYASPALSIGFSPQVKDRSLASPNV